MFKSDHDGGETADAEGKPHEATSVNFLEKSKLDSLLSKQLGEVEMIQSIFCYPGEFDMHDVGIIKAINEFIGEKSDFVGLPPRIDFTLHLDVDGKKFEINVNLPPEYPDEEPEVYVRCENLNRAQQHQLNLDLTKFICALPKGEPIIYQSVTWIQEKSESYFITVGKKKKQKAVSQPKKNDENNKFSRFWIYSHHICSKMKRKCILDLAQEFGITGFCLPGKPGIMCAEGREVDCDEWFHAVRSLNWKKISLKNTEVEKVEKDETIESFRKFTGFEEINFDSNKNKMDMGEFFKYLSNHKCGHVFKDYFGFDGKDKEPIG